METQDKKSNHEQSGYKAKIQYAAPSQLGDRSVAKRSIRNNRICERQIHGTGCRTHAAKPDDNYNGVEGRKKGVVGYRETQEKLEKASEETANVDQNKEQVRRVDDCMG